MQDDDIISSSTESKYLSNWTGTPTKSVESSNTATTNSDSATSNEATNYRTLADIYATSDVVELEEDELYVAEADEPMSYKQASKEKSWRDAMEKELESVEKNNTWELTMLPPGQ